MLRPDALLPGSFNPLHQGHVALAAVASRVLGVTVDYELSIANVDKPLLDETEIERRRSQFASIGRLWITQAPTFIEKARHFPGTAFVVGHDTAVRLVDPKYYPPHPDAVANMLESIRQTGSRFLVGGRIDAAGRFRKWSPELVAERYHDMFFALTEQQFRMDISSTAIRTGANGHG